MFFLGGGVGVEFTEPKGIIYAYNLIVFCIIINILFYIEDMPIPELYAIFLHKNVVKCLYHSCLYVKNEKDIEFWLYFIFINTIIITITAMPCCKFSNILFKIYYIHIILNNLYIIIKMYYIHNKCKYH